MTAATVTSWLWGFTLISPVQAKQTVQMSTSITAVQQAMHSNVECPAVAAMLVQQHQPAAVRE